MIIFQRLNGSPERIESVLTVTSVLRDALMARSPQQPAPGYISGHDETPHIACVALPFVNHRYADGSLKGFAIVLPKGLAEADQLVIFAALNGLEELRSTGGLLWRIRRLTDDTGSTTLSERTWTRNARSSLLIDAVGDAGAARRRRCVDAVGRLEGKPSQKARCGNADGDQVFCHRRADRFRLLALGLDEGQHSRAKPWRRSCLCGDRSGVVHFKERAPPAFWTGQLRGLSFENFAVEPDDHSGAVPL